MHASQGPKMSDPLNAILNLSNLSNFPLFDFPVGLCDGGDFRDMHTVRRWPMAWISPILKETLKRS